MASKNKDLGIGAVAPKQECDDKHCPFHGSLPIRGRSFLGKVIRAKVAKNTLVEWGWPAHVKKYERYEKKRTKLMVHNPPCIKVADGDMVRIVECRKISKTKSFVLVGKVDTQIKDKAALAKAKPVQKTKGE